MHDKKAGTAVGRDKEKVMTEADRKRQFDQWSELEINPFDEKSSTQFFTTGTPIDIFEEIVLWLQGMENVFK